METLDIYAAVDTYLRHLTVPLSSRCVTVNFVDLIYSIDQLRGTSARVRQQLLETSQRRTPIDIVYASLESDKVNPKGYRLVIYDLNYNIHNVIKMDYTEAKDYLFAVLQASIMIYEIE